VNGQTEFDPMKKITVICLILLFGFSAFAQKAKRTENKFSAQQADAVLNRKFHSKLRGIKPARND